MKSVVFLKEFRRLKRLERWLKFALVTVAAMLLWRPRRRQRALAKVVRPGRLLLVRIDNRVGEALLSTPLIAALQARGFGVELLCHPKVARVSEGLVEVIPFHRTFRELRALRKREYVAVLNATDWVAPSVSASVWSRLIAARVPLIGPAAWPCRWLVDIPVARLTDTSSEVRQRLHLASPLIGEPEPPPLAFRAVTLPPWTPTERYWVVNLGGRLPERRAPLAAFAAAARVAVAQGVVPLVTYGPGEEGLADELLQLVPGARRAPPTTLDELAGLLRRAELTVTNNSGPMHLSVAVGCRTVGLFVGMDPARWGHGPPHQMVEIRPGESGVEAVERTLTAIPPPRNHTFSLTT